MPVPHPSVQYVTELKALREGNGGTGQDSEFIDCAYPPAVYSMVGRMSNKHVAVPCHHGQAIYFSLPL